MPMYFLEDDAGSHLFVQLGLTWLTAAQSLVRTELRQSQFRPMSCSMTPTTGYTSRVCQRTGQSIRTVGNQRRIEQKREWTSKVWTIQGQQRRWPHGGFERELRGHLSRRHFGECAPGRPLPANFPGGKGPYMRVCMVDVPPINVSRGSSAPPIRSFNDDASSNDSVRCNHLSS